MSRNAAIAEAIRELANEQDSQRHLIEQVLQVCRDIADGQAEIRSRLIDEVDRLGTRQHQAERRIAALELVAGGAGGR